MGFGRVGTSTGPVMPKPGHAHCTAKRIMPFRLKAGRKTAKDLAHLVRGELRKAECALVEGHSEAGAIHDARTHLKKTRAVLNLLHDALGGDYDDRNDALRAVAHTLSTARDADERDGRRPR